MAEPVLTMDSFFLRCFGVGDGTASAERNHSAYRYNFGEVSLLVDCGEPISRSFKASGLSYDLIDRILQVNRTSETLTEYRNRASEGGD